MVDTIPVKRPAFLPADDEVSGRVQRDDRGNAIWEWKDEDALNQHLYQLGLEIADEPPLRPDGKFSKAAAKDGYNPYSSGMVDKDGMLRPRKLDLRALSEWIALKKARGEDPKG